MKKHLKARFENESAKLLERKFVRLASNKDVEEVFKEELLYNFIKMCGHQQVSALTVVQKMENKRFMIVNNKQTSSVIWNALAENFNSFREKEVRQFYV